MARAQNKGRREQRRLQHKDLGRAQLLDAAEEVFGLKGFHDTSLKEIAERAEYSVGSVYSFFASKDDLFRQIFIRRGSQFMTGMAQVVDQDRSPRELLHALVEFQVEFFRKHKRFGRLFLRYSSSALMSDERLADSAVTDNYEEAMRRQAELFAYGQRVGELQKGDPVVLARMLSGVVSAFQALDPAVMSDDPAARTLMSTDELHGLVDRTFVVEPTENRSAARLSRLK
jgi:TetR/AcrR family transcriptional regulator